MIFWLVTLSARALGDDQSGPFLCDHATSAGSWVLSHVSAYYTAASFGGPARLPAIRTHPVFLYLLHSRVIDQSNQVWATDITYIPMARDFVFLCAIMDRADQLGAAWGCSRDNAFVERLRRSVKYEEVYLHGRQDRLGRARRTTTLLYLLQSPSAVTPSGRIPKKAA